MDNTENIVNEHKNIDCEIESEINRLIGKTESSANKTVLVLSGGGIKGIAYFGAFKALDEAGILKNIKTFATTSVGAMVAAMYLLGYSIKEMENFCELYDFGKLMESKNKMGPLNLINNLGLNDGKNIVRTLIKLAKNKGFTDNVTLLDLYKKTGKKLIVTTTCVTTKEIEYISHENYPNLELTTAIRMTTCVPLVFVPIFYNSKCYVDGGCIDNYPIHLFRNELDRVIGIYIMGNEGKNAEINCIETYLINIIHTTMKGMCDTQIREYENETIKILLNHDNPIGFVVSNEKKNEFFNVGYNIVKKEIIDRKII